jgi:hypothetical protein
MVEGAPGSVLDVAAAVGAGATRAAGAGAASTALGAGEVVEPMADGVPLSPSPRGADAGPVGESDFLAGVDGATGVGTSLVPVNGCTAPPGAGAVGRSAARALPEMRPSGGT